MALASAMPIQIGSARLRLESFNTTMGCPLRASREIPATYISIIFAPPSVDVEVSLFATRCLAYAGGELLPMLNMPKMSAFNCQQVKFCRSDRPLPHRYNDVI